MRKSFFILVFLGVGLAFLPYFGSCQWAKRQIEKRIEKQVGGTCDIGSISLSWFRPQICHQVKWHNKETGLQLQTDRVSIQETLINCLRYQERPLSVKLEGITLDFTAGVKGLRKFQENLHMEFSPIHATLHQGEIAYQRTLVDINGKMHAYSWGKLDLKGNSLEVTLGLPQQLLAKIFKECRQLPEDFFLEIPVSCDLSVNSIQKKLFWYLVKNYAMVTSLHK